MNRTRLATLGLAALLTIFTGCGGSKGPAGPTDATLASDIKTKLNADADLKSLNLDVQVKDGVATVNGNVPDSSAQLKAYKLVQGTTGINKVDDKMQVQAAQVTPPAPTPTPAPVAPAPAPAPVAEQTDAVAATTKKPRRTAESEEATPTAPVSRTITIPEGTRMSVRTIEPIDSKTSQTGQEFRASLSTPVTVDGKTAVPAGADVFVQLANAKQAGRIKGSSSLELHLSRLVTGGETYQLTSATYTVTGKGRGKQTAIRTGIGAAAGSIIGAIAGGGKGAAIGAAAGGGGVAGYQIFTRGEQVKIPAETVITFTLQAPVDVTRQTRPARRAR